jgi:hypothetical protein
MIIDKHVYSEEELVELQREYESRGKSIYDAPTHYCITSKVDLLTKIPTGKGNSVDWSTSKCYGNDKELCCKLCTAGDDADSGHRVKWGRVEIFRDNSDVGITTRFLPHMTYGLKETPFLFPHSEENAHFYIESFDKDFVTVVNLNHINSLVPDMLHGLVPYDQTIEINGSKTRLRFSLVGPLKMGEREKKIGDLLLKKRFLQQMMVEKDV